jgi:predicted amidohydrolase YtcJ
LDRIRKKAKETNRSGWVKGWGFDDTLIAEKRHLTRQDLDKASNANPVFVHHISGHLAYVNSRALQIAGIGSATPDPDGGKIHRDETGMPTGLLSEESAQTLALQHIPVPAISGIKKTLQHAINHYHQYGITSVHDGSIGYYRDGPEVLRAYRELETEGKLTIRVYATIIEDLYDSICRMGLGSGFGSKFMKLGSVKLFQDGSIQAVTAALMDPYLNRPGFRGHALMPQETLNARVKKYHEAGLQIAIHANGDRAIESVLEAIEKACEAYPRQDHRHMIIHCQLASQDHVRRMNRAGVIPSYFINHIYFWGDRHVTEFLGRKRAQIMDPLGSTVKENIQYLRCCEPNDSQR